VGLCSNEVPQKLAERYETEAPKFWEIFYRKNADKFFKDRHYFDREFPELLNGRITILEVGCGVGNTVYPLLELNPEATIYACDFSPTAIDIVKAHPGYSSGRVTAFVADLTHDDLTAHVPPGSVDFVTMVFVLSAISPEKMHDALRNVSRVLRPGTGRLLFRDYGLGDLAQDRHQSSRAKKLGENFYVRGDGTRCYYFQEGELQGLFGGHGLEQLGVSVHNKDVENRKRGIVMHRKWVQGVFQLRAAPHAQPPHLPSTSAMECDAGAPAPPGSWLAGAAGRLVNHWSTLPGVPSGRAQLPDSLDDPHEVVSSMSPGTSTRPSRAQEEEALEREFFETISRDTQDVVAEELAAVSGGIQAIRLVDPADVARGYAGARGRPSTQHTTQQQQQGHATYSVAPGGVAAQGVVQHHHQHLQQGSQHSALQQQQQQQPVLVEVAPGFSLSVRCSPQGLHEPGAELGLQLARLWVSCPRLLEGRVVAELQAHSSGLSAMTAVRYARRYVAAHCDRSTVEQLAANLADNSCRVVVERLRACHLQIGNRNHIRQALQQVPALEPCFQLVVAAGMLEALRPASQEAAAAAIAEVLATARALLQPPAGMASVSVLGSAATGGVQAAVSQDARLLLVEHAGAGQLTEQVLLQAAAAADWVAAGLPQDVQAWSAGTGSSRLGLSLYLLQPV